MQLGSRPVGRAVLAAAALAAAAASRSRGDAVGVKVGSGGSEPVEGVSPGSPVPEPIGNGSVIIRPGVALC